MEFNTQALAEDKTANIIKLLRIDGIILVV